MPNTAPRHIGDVQKAVESAQVDEGTEVGDVLDLAFAHLPDQELLHECLTLGLAFGLENHAARNHDVPTTLVELDDLELVYLADQVLDVRDASQRDLRTRQEGVYAHQVDGHAALDLAHQRALDWTVRIVGFADLLPDPEEVGLFLGKHDDSVVVLEALEQHFDLGTHHWRILELVERNGSLALEAELENYRCIGEAEDPRLDDLAFSKLLEVRAELRQKRLELFLRGRQWLFAERIVNELGRDAVGHIGDRNGESVVGLLSVLFGGGLFSG
jgi:hypothetical protein